MTNFEFTPLSIHDVFLISPFYVDDNRGYFLKSYEKDVFEEHGIHTDIHETFESYSKIGVIRGMHFQTENPQDKIVRCVIGEIFDVAVDLRADSPTFGQWCGEILSSENKKAMLIPKGFAHGFLTISDGAITQYTCSGKYSKGSDTGIIWNDPDLSIDWPRLKNISTIVSERDSKLMTFKKYCETLGENND